VSPPDAKRNVPSFASRPTNDTKLHAHGFESPSEAAMLDTLKFAVEWIDADAAESEALQTMLG
jgi:hypothetical protein